MLGEAVDWLLPFLMAYGLIHCEPLVLKPLGQQLVLAEMSLLMELNSIIPWKIFHPKYFYCQ